MFEMAHNADMPPAPPTHRREHSGPLHELLTLMGHSAQLYNVLVHFVRMLYVSSRHPALCSLRYDLLMRLHDLNVAQIIDIEPCHSFAWLIDACVRDNAVESRRIKELQTSFEGVQSGDALLGDLGMIVASPFVEHTLLRSAYQALLQLIEAGGVPRESEELCFVTQLLALATRAHSNLKDQKFSIPHVQLEVLDEFYPALMAVVVQDLTRQEPAVDGAPPPPERQPPEQAFIELFLKNAVARKVTLYYVLTRIQHKDVESVSELLTLVESLDGVLDLEPAFTQSLVTEVLNAKNHNIRKLAIDMFVLAHRDDSLFIHLQVVRFVSEIQLRVSLKELLDYLQKMLPSKPLDEQEDSVRLRLTQAYNQLLTRCALCCFVSHYHGWAGLWGVRVLSGCMSALVRARTRARVCDQICRLVSRVTGQNAPWLFSYLGRTSDENYTHYPVSPGSYQS
eukprot:TRINITY_DN32432_c0_g1_i1.p1 TRINITY_DN32432_c0_g1~~TRINITY_DN32432_c0_g1_i1.p1  ORF type:complete len:452 (+),score=109.86 TRINITY_DN32432_c0_g1_i1:763-2118(+)